MTLYVVRFIRYDGKPDEEYVYRTYEDALAHYSLFKNDDSGLYEKIEIIDFDRPARSIKELEIER